MKPIPILIPCAGKGSRTGLRSPKALFKVDGVPILISIIRKVLSAFNHCEGQPFFYISYAHHAQLFKSCLKEYELFDSCELVYQPFQDGHGRAVYDLISHVKREGSDPNARSCLIWGDCVGFRSSLLNIVFDKFNPDFADVCLPGLFSNSAYTLFELDMAKRVLACKETRDEHLNAGFTDIGIFAFRLNVLEPYLKDEVDCAMRQSRETSFIKGLSKACSHLTVRFLDCATDGDKHGFNSFEDLN